MCRVAEIDGIPPPLRRAFSTRRLQIEAELSRTGRAGPKAARVACLNTRPAKQHQQLQSLRERWWATARRLGFHPRMLLRVLRRNTLPAHLDLPTLTRAVLGAQGATRQSSTFDQGALVREICQHLAAGKNVSTQQLLRLAGQLLQHPDVLPVIGEDGRAYTTLELLSTEQHALDLVQHRDGDALRQIVPTGPANAADRLRPDQQQLVVALLRSGRGVEVVAGEAGSGKTAALAAATQAWTAAGIDVRGTAVAALTAQGLQDATGASSVSLARLLYQPEKHLPTGGVLLVDEAGMIGTRTLTGLLDLSQSAGCKVVLVGDPSQLPELEAGGLFGALTQQPDTIRLTGHHRQTQPWERQALTDLRHGRTDQALDAYTAHDRLHTASTSGELLTELADDYIQHRAKASDPWQVLVLAQRRLDLRLLNGLIRNRLADTGTLGSQRLVVTTPTGPVEYRPGEQVLITRNDHPRGLLNGHTGTVTHVRNNSLTLQLRDGRDITLDRGWLSQGTLEYGYALTLHKAQGRTVHTALLWGDSSLYQEAGYVGLSRGTHTNHLYLAPGNEKGEDDCWPHRRQPAAPDDNRSRGLSLSHAQQLATHQLDHDAGRGRNR